MLSNQLYRLTQTTNTNYTYDDIEILQMTELILIYMTTKTDC